MRTQRTPTHWRSQSRRPSFGAFRDRPERGLEGKSVVYPSRVEWRDLPKILAPWIFVPLTAIDWWMARGRLPERVVMKFGANRQPTSWATPGQAMRFDLVLLASVLALGSALVLVVALVQPEKTARMLLATAVCSAFCFLLLNGVLWIYQVP